MTDDQRHDREMQRRYGLLPGQYRQMLAAQDGRCFICGGYPRPDRRLVLDHDHDTGEARGLLCDGCNTFLARAETYLGRRQPHSRWPLPPGPGLWVNGELLTWRSIPLLDEYGPAPWEPRWELQEPWRLQPEPKAEAAARRRREREWKERSSSLFDDLTGLTRPRPSGAAAGNPAPIDGPAGAVASRVPAPPAPRQGQAATRSPSASLDPPPAPQVRRYRPPGAGEDPTPPDDRQEVEP